MGTKILTSYIWCRCGLSHDVRGLVPWWWMHGLDGRTLDALLSRKFGGRTSMFWRLREKFIWFVTISKLPFSLHTFTWIIFLACFDFMCHVVNTCLDEPFIKTCVYTCSSSEQQLILICLSSLLICTHYMYMYNLFLMILSFILVFSILFCFMYMLFLFKTDKYTCIPWVTCLHAKFYYGLVYVWDMYVYF